MEIIIRNDKVLIDGVEYIKSQSFNNNTSEDVFNKIFEYILSVEGGYSNDKADKGGKTKYGIIEVEARKYGYKGDMKDLTKDIAKDIYKNKYYLSNNLDKIKDKRVALSIADWTINSGSWGLKKAQQAVNILKGDVLVVDGRIGEKSIEAINSVNPELFLTQYHELQRKFYKAIVDNNPSQSVFLKGWLNRVIKKENYIKNMGV
jgi:lysozyme family protein